MPLKILLGFLFLLMLVTAFLTGRRQPKTLSDDRNREGSHLRLMTWNIGYGDLEPDTRAHTQDLTVVARIIMDNDPDAVALQELTGEDQLKVLLALLKDRYHGRIGSSGNADRVTAVLVRDRSARFEDVPAGGKFAAAATFRINNKESEIVLVSVHADAFSSSHRRTLTADVVDWTRSRARGEIAFIAGDLNFEVSVRNKNNLFTDDATHDSEAYVYFLKYFRDLGRDAGETSINERRIDYVFGPTGTVTLRRAQVLRGASVHGMDHWPLLVEVSF